MYFKIEYELKNVSINYDETIQTSIKNKHEETVTILGPNRKSKDNINPKCVARSEDSPTSEIMLAFEDYFKNYKVIRGCNHIPELDSLSENFKNYIENMQIELETTATRVINIFLWRLNPIHLWRQSSNTKPLISFSPDEVTWYVSPFAPRPVIAGFYSAYSFSKTFKKEFSNLVSNTRSAPLHHELFRQSYELRSTHPQMSLVIGIISLESAIKTTISNLVPDATWLSINIQSPPIDKILRQYLPKLPVKNKINSQARIPSKAMLKNIEEASVIRNKIVHRGTPIPDNFNLSEVLNDISDVIWLLDFFCGHEWAQKFVRKETLELFYK